MTELFKQLGITTKRHTSLNAEYLFQVTVFDPMRTLRCPNLTHLTGHLLNLGGAFAAGGTILVEPFIAAVLGQLITVTVLINIGTGIGCRKRKIEGKINQ